MPRVFAPLSTPPDGVPRAVLVQRRRKLFASQDVRQAVLEELELYVGGPYDVAHLVTGGEGGAAAGSSDSETAVCQPQSRRLPWLPLEAFDDDAAFETRAPRGWVPADPERARPPARVARRSGAGGTEWAAAVVLDCNEARGAYLVRFEADGGSSSMSGSGAAGGDTATAAPAAAAAAERTEWVPRVAVCFGAEDPRLYARRYAAALLSRAHAEAAARYDLAVTAMPPDGAPQMAPEQVNRVISKALSTTAMRERLMDAGAHVAEANAAHARAANRAAYDALAAAQRAAAAEAARLRGAGGDGAGGGQGGALLLPDDPALNPAAPAELLPLEPPPPPLALPAGICGGIGRATAVVVTMAAAGDPGADDDERTAFERRRAEFVCRTLLTQPAAVAALVRVRAECAKARRAACLFGAAGAKPLRLDEFEQAHAAAADAAANSLRDDWLAAVARAVRSQFKDVGKGWYSLAEARHDAYGFSKMRRLLVRPVIAFAFSAFEWGCILCPHPKPL